MLGYEIIQILFFENNIKYFSTNILFLKAFITIKTHLFQSFFFHILNNFHQVVGSLKNFKIINIYTKVQLVGRNISIPKQYTKST
jgi:hypothetical protein